MTYVQREIRTLAKVTGLEPTKINLWKVAFEDFSESHTTLQNLIYKRRRKYAASRTSLSSGRIFQCVLGLAYHGSGAIESVAVQ